MAQWFTEFRCVNGCIHLGSFPTFWGRLGRCGRLRQSLAGEGEELRRGGAGEVGGAFGEQAAVGFVVVVFEPFDEMMAGVAVAVAMADDDDAAVGDGGGDGEGDVFVKAGVFGGAFAGLAGLVLVGQVMQDVMRVMGFDDVVRGVRGAQVEMVDAGFVVIDGDQEVGGVGGRDRGVGGPAGTGEEMAEEHDLVEG